MTLFHNKFAISETVWIDLNNPGGPLEIDTDQRCRKQGAVPAVVTGISIVGDPETISYRVCYQTHNGSIIDNDWLPEYVLKHREWARA